MNIRPMHISAWARLGMEKSVFGVGLSEILGADQNTYCVTADLCGYSGMDRLLRMFPNQIVNVGIQEQNMLGVAAGLALEGNTVFAGSYASFAVARAMEQVRHFLSVLNLDIKLIGYNTGYAKGSLGISHWATEDIAFTRCLPGVTVICPADSMEAVKAAIACSSYHGPVYLRLSGISNIPAVYSNDYTFEIGKGIPLRKGNDIAIIATGLMVHESLKAADLLHESNIEAAVINLHTLKPIDSELISSLLQKYDHVFTVEEHNIIGGLGSAVAEIASSIRNCAVIHRLGMHDNIESIGSVPYIWQNCGLTSQQIYRSVTEVLRQ